MGRLKLGELMGRMILGTAIAAVVMYLFGFLYWGASLVPYGALKQAGDPHVAGQALLGQFPDRGTYMVPSPQNMATSPDLMEKGPVAIIHMTAPAGRPAMDPAIMAGGFGMNLVVIVLLALLMQRLAPKLPAYGDKALLSIGLAAIAAIAIHGGDAVWWQVPLPWKLVQGLYDFAFLAGSGLILARFIGPKAA